eukprot:TRINITY_DN26644_c0_g1_i1.p1 TRINITY_DN26644_c0_g1~~TRINITY_DN26644_c0_g1_i1.p1  ORF type:complete len:111 (+),score=33.02 TRINITY_DN26644_c0_g1_i1:74-406(+)
MFISFFFFFFKQKTAYEMLRSLVGSEMCIRDRYQRRVRVNHRQASGGRGQGAATGAGGGSFYFPGEPEQCWAESRQAGCAHCEGQGDGEVEGRPEFSWARSDFGAEAVAH